METLPYFDPTKLRRIPTFVNLARIFYHPIISKPPHFSHLEGWKLAFSTGKCRETGGESQNKVYGVLHPLYPVYLLAYFGAMIYFVMIATVHKTVNSNAHAIVVAMAVFVNIGVWLIGQLVHVDFEFLSVSYIISELFLLGLQYVRQDEPETLSVVKEITPQASEPPIRVYSDETIHHFLEGGNDLTRTERRIYELYIKRKTTKEVLAELNITENTLKYHNKNIYGKLKVSSRKQLR